MPTPKIDPNSGALIFIPTPYELEVIRERRAIKGVRAELTTMRDELSKELEEIRKIKEDLKND